MRPGPLAVHGIHPAAEVGGGGELLEADDAGRHASQDYRVDNDRAELSIRSSARHGLPHRPRCRNPTAESSPAISSAATASWTSMVYPKDSIALAGSGG